MSKIADQVFELVAPIADSFGYEVVEVEYTKKFDGMYLIIYIDKDGGVTINDCEKLHRAIDQPLDELDPISEAYMLSVSSLGIDRPLKTERDYLRNMNKKISVKLYQAVDKKKVFTGVLVAYDQDTLTIEEDGIQTVFEKSKTAHIEPVIEF